MYQFSLHSKTQNRSLYPWLHLVLKKLILKHDFRSQQGGRSEEEQWDFYNNGTSTLAPPEGKHLLRRDPSGDFPGVWSFAVDVRPYINGRPIATDKENFGPAQQAQFAYFLATLRAEAEEVLKGTGWELREGINWDGDAEILTDQDFDDWFHVEIVRED